MNSKIYLTIASSSLALTLLAPLSAQAESQSYTCSYTHAVYTAPFMKNPSTRNCPEGRCSYTVMINDSKASINGVSGFTVEQNDQQIILKRSAKDPVMGGIDTTKLSINKSDMSFESVKTTTPSVVLTTKGSCS